jgi:BNR repeat-containing family member
VRPLPVVVTLAAAGLVLASSASAADSRLGPGGWSWFADPRAVYVGGHTITGWVDWRRWVVIASLGPEGTTRVRIAREDQPKTGPHLRHHQRDDHGNPALLVEPDGRITAYYSGHGGPHMNWRTTLRPGDISAWGPIQRLPVNIRGPAGYTYPNPVRLADEGRTYLFWRGGRSLPTFSSTDSTGAWAPAMTLIRPVGHQRPYVKVSSNDRDRIDFAFTNGHPRNDVSGVYYAQYRAGALYRASGAPIKPVAALPLRRSESDLVFDAHAHHERAWVWDVAEAGDGRPVVVFAVFRHRGRLHRYKYSRWNGSAWETHDLGSAGRRITRAWAERYYSGGIALDHRDPRVVYASVGRRRHHRIKKMVTPDGGKTWLRSWINHGAGTDNVRPVVPRGLPPGQNELLWMRGFYNIWAKFRTSIVARR